MHMETASIRTFLCFEALATTKKNIDACCPLWGDASACARYIILNIECLFSNRTTVLYVRVLHEWSAVMGLSLLSCDDVQVDSLENVDR